MKKIVAIFSIMVIVALGGMMYYRNVYNNILCEFNHRFVFDANATKAQTYVFGGFVSKGPMDLQVKAIPAASNKGTFTVEMVEQNNRKNILFKETVPLQSTLKKNLGFSTPEQPYDIIVTPGQYTGEVDFSIFLHR